MSVLSFDVPTTTTTDDSSPEQQQRTGQAAPVRRSRNRAQQSCAACHQRKQACDKKVPCQRCIKRGVADECYIAEPGGGGGKSNGSGSATNGKGKTNLPTPPDGSGSSPEGGSMGVSISLGTDKSLQARVIALEAALKATIGQGASRPNQSSIDDDVETAAVALGQLATSHVEGSRTTGSFGHVYAGPGSVTEFLKATLKTSPGTNGLAMHPPDCHHVVPDSMGPSFYSSLIAAFPPRPLCEHLTNLFYSGKIMSLRFSVTRKDFFEKGLKSVLDYKETLEAIEGITLPRPTAISFLALASVSLATALQFLPTESEEYVKHFAPDFRTVEQALMVQAREAVDRSELEEQADMHRVEAILLLGVYLKNMGRPTTNYSLVACAIRTAQAMGMHREPSPGWGLSPFETEIRKRLWWTLYAYDRCSNFAFGRPYVIHTIHCDVSLPSNCDIDTVDPSTTSPLPSKPLTEITSYSSSLFEINLATIVGHISDRVFSAQPSSYKDVLECDMEISAFENALPDNFKNPSFDVLQEHPFLSSHLQFIQNQTAWARACLHRPLLLKPMPPPGQPDHFVRSRTAVIALSQKLLSAQRDLQITLTQVQKRFFLICFQTFDPACNLAMAVLTDPTNVVKAETLDPWIVEGRDMLARMGPDNVVAREGVRCLDVLRQKIVDLFPPGTRLTPVPPVSLGPTAIPYGGLTSYDTLQLPLATTKSTASPMEGLMPTPPMELPSLPPNGSPSWPSLDPNNAFEVPSGPFTFDGDDMSWFSEPTLNSGTSWPVAFDALEGHRMMSGNSGLWSHEQEAAGDGFLSNWAQAPMT